MPLLADGRVAAKEARIGAIFARVGLIPEFGATYMLPRIVGLPKACELVFTGKIIDAKEALEIGLVNHVYPPDKLMEEAKGFANKLASLPRLAMEASKKIINRGLEMDLSSGLEFEARCFGNLATTHDLKEGILAFLEKRKPKFSD